MLLLFGEFHCLFLRIEKTNNSQPICYSIWYALITPGKTRQALDRTKGPSYGPNPSFCCLTSLASSVLYTAQTFKVSRSIHLGSGNDCTHDFNPFIIQVEHVLHRIDALFPQQEHCLLHVVQVFFLFHVLYVTLTVLVRIMISKRIWSIQHSETSVTKS